MARQAIPQPPSPASALARVLRRGVRCDPYHSFIHSSKVRYRHLPPDRLRTGSPNPSLVATRAEKSGGAPLDGAETELVLVSAMERLYAFALSAHAIRGLVI